MTIKEQLLRIATVPSTPVTPDASTATVKIGDREIGHGQPAYVVAEVGCNSSGSLSLAKVQIRDAKESGADAVKFQKRTITVSVPRHMWTEMRETPWGEMPYLDYRLKVEFGAEQYSVLFRYAGQLGIDVFVSVWDKPSVDFMEQFDPIAYKIPSPCITDMALLRHVKKTGRPIIMSTGMSTEREIGAALYACKPDIVCQCTAAYPVAPEEINLRYITALQGRLGPKTLIGYSSHETGYTATLGAVALGACYIERHFTNDSTQWGSDQAMSMEPREFADMVKAIREMEAALGDGTKVLYDSEKSKMASLRRFVNK